MVQLGFRSLGIFAVFKSLLAKAAQTWVPSTEGMSRTPDFLRKSTLGLCAVSLLTFTPFAINNFVQGRYLLGAGASLIIVVFALNAANIVRSKYYSGTLLFFSIVPAILFFLSLSIRTQGMIGVLWCYPAVLSFYCMLPERKAWLANAALLFIVLPLAWQVIDPALALRMSVTLLIISTFSIIFVRVIGEQQAKLLTLAVTDPLTGLYNRSLLQDTLERVIAQSQRTGVPVALISLDIDHFKAVNDSFGHGAGDAVLCGVGGLLGERLRASDRAFRIGGEEFLIVLHNANLASAQRVAEELRLAVASLPLLAGQPVTASLGVAEAQANESWTSWMRRCDQRLYRAKAAGRNQVVS